MLVIRVDKWEEGEVRKNNALIFALQSRNMEQIIRYGFKCINFTCERKVTLMKGFKLVESKHVHDVLEVVEPTSNCSRITARVIPQTKVGNTPYDVCIEVSLTCTKVMFLTVKIFANV